jgi:C-terminal processing protease CtpA/Prc
VVWVPNARSISPVTGTDWEGVGVAPDVRVSADDALTTAERLAAEKIQLNAAGQAKPPEATSSAAAGSDATSAKAN